MYLILSSAGQDGSAPPARLRPPTLTASRDEPPATATAGDDERPLLGRKVLLVEDEAIVAMSVEDALRDLGCAEVNVALSLAEGLALAAAKPVDAAILDVNLRGTEVFPLADLLTQRATPFVLATWYGPEMIRADLRHHLMVRKPYQPRDLREALQRLLAKRADALPLEQCRPNTIGRRVQLATAVIRLAPGRPPWMAVWVLGGE